MLSAKSRHGFLSGATPELRIAVVSRDDLFAAVAHLLQCLDCRSPKTSMGLGSTLAVELRMGIVPCLVLVRRVLVERLLLLLADVLTGLLGIERDALDVLIGPLEVSAIARVSLRVLLAEFPSALVGDALGIGLRHLLKISLLRHANLICAGCLS